MIGKLRHRLTIQSLSGYVDDEQILEDELIFDTEYGFSELDSMEVFMEYLGIHTNTRDTTGQPIETWEEASTRWGSIEPLTGREYWQAQQVNAEMTTKITIRYCSGLTTTQRLKYGTRVFDILSIQNIDEANKYMVLMCKEVV